MSSCTGACARASGAQRVPTTSIDGRILRFGVDKVVARV
jgi:hypothetical protein